MGITAQRLLGITNIVYIFSGAIAVTATLFVIILSNYIGNSKDLENNKYRTGTQLRIAEMNKDVVSLTASNLRSEERISSANKAAAEANERVAEAELRTKSLEIKLVEAQRFVSGRTITEVQANELKKVANDCGVGVAVQADYRDFEADSFKQSLEFAFLDAGIKIFPYELPTLDPSEGSDIKIYSPRYTRENFAGIIHSSLYKTLSEFGFSVGATNSATMLTDQQVRTDENEIMQYPPFCIIRINKRPPPRLGSRPYFAKTTGQYYSEMPEGLWTPSKKR